MSVVSDTYDFLTAADNYSGSGAIPTRMLEHVTYTAETIAIAGVIAIPLGLWIGHTGRFRSVAVALTGALRALPTLGLLTALALVVGIGLTAPLISLVILAVPPLLAGAYSGVESVDRQTVDAARAMGMTEMQILRKVEIPLALPIIVGGIRSGVLQVVATATVAAFVGLGGLGRFIINGQAISDYAQMAAGSVLVVVLALVLDGIFAGLQQLATGRRPAPQPSTA
ncbi:ABC transporter permease [Aeromicrobium sp. CF3.5]|uniref:ABC transporter permease n=1 Tax=Aeromicrobium sp. CF3.5 TaxID=3373078 RepID=UPI003EE5448B